MKKPIILLLIFVGSFGVEAQIFKNADKFLKQNSGLTEKDAASGIKEALIKGSGQAVGIVANVDGFFGNPQIKIPFPPEAKEIEDKLRAIGLGEKVDEVVLTINRAAENAANEAKTIFISAIKKMTITDAINIVKGSDDAATQYLKRTSSAELTAKFKPHIQASLDKVQATKYWDEVISTYNKIPLVQKMNPDLSSYVTARAIEGLFVMVAQEELKIRKDPLARTSEILRKVFGNK